VNTPPTLDHFETALLEELRAHVAERPATEAVPQRPRRTRRRWAAGLATAAAAATAYVVVAPGGPAASPAYAVTQDADGDVVVTVHRLEDAAGLESALRAHGIDASVDFDPQAGDGPMSFSIGDGEPGDTGAQPPEGGTIERHASGGDDGPHLSQRAEDGDAVTDATPVRPGAPGRGDADVDPGGCGPVGSDPATLTRDGADWVLEIPADSPLQDRHVDILTGAGGTLGVFYAGDEAGSYCGVMSVNG
jgi:hypothetical protein